MKTFNKSVYLAGAISYYRNIGKPEQAEEWRKQAQETLNYYDIKCFNPCKNENGDFADEMIVKQNIYYLDQCSIVLVNLDMITDSVGSIFELTYAQEHNKLVVAFGASPWFDRPHLKYLIDIKFDTLNEALEHISIAYDQ